ncbi:hypothetical protein LCGC14_2020170 [marine sediment metagenome]|uniref:Uncharacterized protein n=1 Tax=marine sediment metagenome TaxID=412755 RepID=A0A0F9HB22_9ZZZZ
MINELFGDAVVGLFAGVLIGIIESWNKKVFFGLLVLGLIFVIIIHIFVGSPYSAEYQWWRTIFGVVFVVIGAKVGNFIYEETF